MLPTTLSFPPKKQATVKPLTCHLVGERKGSAVTDCVEWHPKVHYWELEKYLFRGLRPATKSLEDHTESILDQFFRKCVTDFSWRNFGGQFFCAGTQRNIHTYTNNCFYDSHKSFRRLWKNELTLRKLLDQKSWTNTTRFPTSGRDKKKVTWKDNWEELKKNPLWRCLILQYRSWDKLRCRYNYWMVYLGVSLDLSQCSKEMYLLKSKKNPIARLLEWILFPEKALLQGLFVHFGRRRKRVWCWRSKVPWQPTHTLSSKRLLTGFTGITKHSQQQETSVSKAKMKEGAEVKKEAIASHFVNQAANSDGQRRWCACLFNGVQGRIPGLSSVTVTYARSIPALLWSLV